jgi:alkaline phosphatase D
MTGPRDDGREPSAGRTTQGDADSAGHTGLADRLSADLALPTAPATTEDRSAFAIDPAREAGTGFPQSVASGDPTPEGVVLWTRLDPERYDPAKPVGIALAAEEDFERVLYRGVLTDPEIVTAHDHTLKVDLEGELDADRTYYYRFTHDGYHSKVGRCRTLPDSSTEIDSISFAVVTCQDFQNGYYGAYAHIAEEAVDFLVHVGDFVYESAEGQFAGRHEDFSDREVTLPSGHDHAWGLEDYRYLYRTYKSDPHCQRALRRHTLIAGRDDHEVANELHWDYEVDGPGAEHPRGDDPEFMQGLTTDAIHAWWEYMPVQVRYDPSATSLHERFRLWRAFEFGDLLELIVTDERLFRSAPRAGLPTGGAVSPENEPPGRTMLGAEQREWFVEEVTNSEALWTVWCDEVLTVPFRVGAGRASLYPVPGSWDGYTRERREIARALDRADVSNFVTLTGDMHCYIAGYKQTEYRDAIGTRLEGPVSEADRLGVEFMTPAMTSITVAEGLHLGGTRLEAPVGKLIARAVRAQNPHIDFFDSHHNGYSLVEFTREACTYSAYAVDKTDDSADAEKELLAAYRVPEGQVVLEDVTAERRVAEERDRRGATAGRRAGADRPGTGRENEPPTTEDPTRSPED